MSVQTRRYWNGLASRYQAETHILTTDFHYGPLIPGDRILGLLPRELRGLRCLELGCGAGQNSIHLAHRGATCVALDLSEGQLQTGKERAEARGCHSAWLQADLDALPLRRDAVFDLVHSCYALPFVSDQAAVVRRMASLVAPGGQLLLSTAHPVAMGEWLDLDADESGIFLPSYFEPPPECHTDESGNGSVCRAVPLADLFSWLTASGLRVEHLLEPRPLPLEGLSRAEIQRTVPYWSEAWLALYEDLQRVPFVAIFSARRPSA